MIPESVLPEPAASEVRQELSCARERIERVVAANGGVAMEAQRDIVVHAIAEALRNLCGDSETGIEVEGTACPQPLRLPWQEAQAVATEIQAVNERLNLLIEQLRPRVPPAAMAAVVACFAQILGFSYTEFLRPLRHQYPPLDPANRNR